MREFRGGETIFPGPGRSTVFLHKATMSVSFPPRGESLADGLGGAFEGRRSTCVAPFVRSVQVTSREGGERPVWRQIGDTASFDGGTGTATLSAGISCPALHLSKGFYAWLYRVTSPCTRHGCGDVRKARERGGEGIHSSNPVVARSSSFPREAPSLPFRSRTELEPEPSTSGLVGGRSILIDLTLNSGSLRGTSLKEKIKFLLHDWGHVLDAPRVLGQSGGTSRSLPSARRSLRGLGITTGGIRSPALTLHEQRERIFAPR